MNEQLSPLKLLKSEPSSACLRGSIIGSIPLFGGFRQPSMSKVFNSKQQL